MRVLLVSHRYPPRHTAGAELHAARLARELARRGRTARVVAAEKDVGRPDLSLTEREHEGVAVTEVVNNLYHRGLRATWDRPEIDRLFGALLERTRPELVHVHHLMYLSIGCVEQAARRGIAVVMTLHDFWLQCPRFGQRLHADGSPCATIDHERCGGCLTGFKHAQTPLQRSVGRAIAGLRRRTGLDLAPLATGLDRGLRRRGAAAGTPRPRAAAEGLAAEAAERDAAIRARLLPAVDLFLAPSGFLAERFVEWGLPPGRIRRADTGVDELPVQARRRTGEGPLRVLFLGTLAAHKGAHVLLEAWGRLPAKLRERGRLDLHGPPGGDAAYLARLERAARACGANLRGRLDREQVVGALVGCDLLVVPSVWYENQPLVVLEAIATRTPLLVSDIGGMAELVAEGESGLRFRSGDAGDLARRLGALLADPAPLAALYRAGPARPSLADSVDALEAIYAEALGCPAPVAEVVRGRS